MENLKSLFENGSADPELLSQIRGLSVDAVQYLKFLGISIFGFLLIASMARFLLGKKAQLTKAVTSAIEIFFLYAISVVVYSFGLELRAFIAPLPLVAMAGDHLVFFPLLQAEFPALCAQLLHLLIIAFLVNLLTSIIPKGDHLLTWLLLRFLSVVAAVALIYGISLLLDHFVPQTFAAYTPMILLLVLVVLVILGTMRLLIGASIAMASPLLAALYTFFFNNFIGRAISKSIVTTLLLAGLVVALNALGIFAILIAPAALTAYIPLLLIVFGLWILIGHVFCKE